MRWIKRLLRALSVLALLGLVAVSALGFWAWRALSSPMEVHGEERVISVLPGQGAWSILRQMEAEGILPNARLARVFLAYRLKDAPLKAGEYLFDQPLNTTEVLAKLIRGQVVSHPVTVIEGLDLEETAAHLARSGFGDETRLRQEMGRVSLIADLDPLAENLEGYLYPDTYHFARGTSEAEIVAKLVATFRQRFEAEVRPLMTGDLGIRELVTLASIVEKESGVDEERPIIAGVYSNRLARNIALYADPTVIYAKKLLGDWDGNLRRPDLALDSPYNTYVYPGLPPGPICSPGVASILAAAAPAEVSYLYFVSRNDGTHAFAATLREHQRNVDRWQRRYWREKWAAERRKGGSQPRPD